MSDAAKDTVRQPRNGRTALLILLAGVFLLGGGFAIYRVFIRRTPMPPWQLEALERVEKKAADLRDRASRAPSDATQSGFANGSGGSAGLNFPPDFPSDIPFPAGSVVKYVETAGSPDQHAIVLQAPGGPYATLTFCGEQMREKGWTLYNMRREEYAYRKQDRTILIAVRMQGEGAYAHVADAQISIIYGSK